MSENAPRKRRKTTIGGAFAPRLIEMIGSPAFCVLSLSARRVLDRLEIELASHGGTDNGKLPVTFADFQRYGIDYDAIAPAIREVVALGFVEITKPGRAGNAEYRTPNIFRLTYRPTDYDNATEDWRRITGSDQAKVTASEARKAINKNYNSSRGKPGVSVGENRVVPVGETPTTVSPGKPRLLTISPSGSPQSVVPPKRKARVARPSKGAVASGPVSDVANVTRLSGDTGEQISKRHKCLHCNERGETVVFAHDEFVLRLHRNCIDRWKAGYEERNRQGAA